VSCTGQRVSMHDLIREYARELADAEGEQQEARSRLLDWHVHTARAAMAHVDPDVRLLTPTVPEPTGRTRMFADRDSATAWLNSERNNTVALVVHAAQHGWPVHAWQLAYVTAYHFYLTRQVDDWITTQRSALEAVRQVGDFNGEAKVLTALGHALIESDQYAPFLDCQRRAVELAIATNNKRLQAEAQYYVAFGLFRTGELSAAFDANALAVELYREIDDRPGEVATVYLAGQIYLRLGKTQQGLEYVNQTLDYLRARGRRYDEAAALLEVGMAHIDLARLPRAQESVELALGIARDLDDRMLEAQALHHLGQVTLKQGLPLEALRLQEEALAHARQLSGRLTECMVLNGLGQTLALYGEHEKAREHFDTALEIASRINDPYELEAARTGIAMLIDSSSESNRRPSRAPVR
jgi:tetratricopeptide (TPR) repeat protein